MSVLSRTVLILFMFSLCAPPAFANPIKCEATNKLDEIGRVKGIFQNKCLNCGENNRKACAECAWLCIWGGETKTCPDGKTISCPKGATVRQETDLVEFDSHEKCEQAMAGKECVGYCRPEFYYCTRATGAGNCAVASSSSQEKPAQQSVDCLVDAPKEVASRTPSSEKGF